MFYISGAGVLHPGGWRSTSGGLACRFDEKFTLKEDYDYVMRSHHYPLLSPLPPWTLQLPTAVPLLLTSQMPTAILH